MKHVVPFYPIPTPPKEDFFKLGLDITGGEIVPVKGSSLLGVLGKTWGHDVHAHGRGFPFPEACGLFARKGIYTPHNDTLGAHWWTRAVRRFLFNKYAFIAAQTQFGRDSFIDEGINPDRIVVMPTPVDHAFFSKASKREGAAFRKRYKLGKDHIALAVGIRPLKNPLVIAEACEKAGVKAVMLGATREEELRKAWGSARGFEWFLPPEELSEMENVVLPGQLPPQGVRAAMAAADVFVNSSDYECFGLVAYEAASAGVPMCLPDYGSFGVFRECALFHDAMDAGKLAANIKKYLDYPKLGAANAKKAGAIAAGFDYPVVRRQWENFYRRHGFV
jgi:glycosyltransferase involved in cell wall biosynthesis